MKRVYWYYEGNIANVCFPFCNCKDKYAIHENDNKRNFTELIKTKRYAIKGMAKSKGYHY